MPIAFNLRMCDFDDVIDANHQSFANLDTTYCKSY